jgi:hypothetical protein
MPQKDKVENSIMEIHDAKTSRIKGITQFAKNSNLLDKIDKQVLRELTITRLSAYLHAILVHVIFLRQCN